MKLANTMKVVVLTLGLGILLQVGLVAQSVVAKPTGTLEGLVIDPINARVTRASIKIEGRRFKQEIESDEEGRFQIELPTGTYQISAYCLGFGLFQQKNVKVKANATTTINVPLKIAPVGPCIDTSPKRKEKSKNKKLMICM